MNVTGSSTGGPPVLALEGVSFAYGSQTVLEDIHLTVAPGDFLGLIGPNGSGKTTLLKIMLGLIRPDSGKVRWFGHDAVPRREMGRRVAYVPQVIHTFAPGFPATVAEVVATGRTAVRGLFRPMGRADWQAVDQVLESVGMASARDQRVSELSGGQQQRVFIARALAAKPQVLLLDEPTAGVDVAAQERFYNLLGRLHTEHGLTLILVSHDIGMITNRVNRLACLNRRLYYHGGIEGFLQEVDLKSVYGEMHMISHHHHDHNHHDDDQCRRSRPSATVGGNRFGG